MLFHILHFCYCLNALCTGTAIAYKLQLVNSPMPVRLLSWWRQDAIKHFFKNFLLKWNVSKARSLLQNFSISTFRVAQLFTRISINHKLRLGRAIRLTGEPVSVYHDHYSSFNWLHTITRAGWEDETVLRASSFNPASIVVCKFSRKISYKYRRLLFIIFASISRSEV